MVPSTFLGLHRSTYSPTNDHYRPFLTMYLLGLSNLSRVGQSISLLEFRLSWIQPSFIFLLLGPTNFSYPLSLLVYISSHWIVTFNIWGQRTYSKPYNWVVILLENYRFWSSLPNFILHSETTTWISRHDLTWISAQVLVRGIPSTCCHSIRL